MEETNPLVSKKSEYRPSLKKCFKNPIFSLVPFEVWRDLVVSNADLKTIALLSQTCWGFKETVDLIGENNFNLALLLRREGQISLARKFLLRCANNNNSRAMFHLGYGFDNFGWGLEQDKKNAFDWFEKSAIHGDSYGMVHLSFCLGLDEDDSDLSFDWACKAVKTKCTFANAYCLRFGLAEHYSLEKSAEIFESCATKGDELAQYHLGQMYLRGIGVEKDNLKATYWLSKCAEQGLSQGQFNAGQNSTDRDTALSWFKKASQQGHPDALTAFKVISAFINNKNN